ncbi:phosphotransferase enzyme family protein [Penicillium capsulatum]|uniref:Phosphotransferase enzyme family protein n=1 Tax=Penicillium capsulatum TaxID=69766 RepID=A0A9W9ISB1_9EURO|nr:phosphotransferase enzyme family protein [Penicillium capsulatum]KAJ6121316.1 phosphotransferase enzyme family protein [Penicillium capsulatum]
MTRFSAIAEILPDESIREMNFLESSFFKQPSKSIPTPTQLRALSKDIHANPRPRPMIFEELKVFVKFGPYVTMREVPKILGWRVDEENYVLLYMELSKERRCRMVGTDLGA